MWCCPTQGASQPCDRACGHGVEVLLPPLPQQVIQQQRVDVAREGEAALMGLVHGLCLQIRAGKPEEHGWLAGELFLFSGHLQNIRLFIVSHNFADIQNADYIFDKLLQTI